MKQLKTSSKNLRDLFQNNILVRDIAEGLESCKADNDAVFTRKHMKEREFDVMGIEDNGSVYGYIEQTHLKEGACKQYEHTFHPSELITESAPLLDLLPILHDKPRVFVLERNKVTGIVTRGDLQKVPVRMLLFGLVSLLEMQLLRVIRSCYPDTSWQSLIKKERVEKAKECLDKLQKSNEAIDLADCLQFCDKRDIILETPVVLKALNFGSKNKVYQVLEKAENLRNNMAHSQVIASGPLWPETLDLVADIQKILERLETI